MTVERTKLLSLRSICKRVIEAYIDMTTPHVNEQPVIGVTSRHGNIEWLEKNTENYMRIVEEQRAHLVVLSPDAPAVLPDGATYEPNTDGALLTGILESLDGLILSGGGDVHPRYFGQELDGAETDRISRERDTLELELTRSALDLDIPVFGICRGCQVLNVAAGGGLVQHFEGHRSPEDHTAFHKVNLVEGAKVRDAAGSDAIIVNTFHHQGIDELSVAPGYLAAGFADPDTWIVEAIESISHTWAVGVQWHPERTFELDEAHRRIWNAFFDACSRRNIQRHA